MLYHILSSNLLQSIFSFSILASNDLQFSKVLLLISILLSKLFVNLICDIDIQFGIRLRFKTKNNFGAKN